MDRAPEVSVGVSATVSAALFGLLSLALRYGPREISLTSASTLATLERTGSRRITDLAAVEGVTQPGMTSMVTRLERDGLVERIADPTDGRVVLVSLTSAGTECLEDMRLASTHVFEVLIGKLSPEELSAMVAAVPALNQLQHLETEQRLASVRALSPVTEN